ncbi:anti-sigma factor [Devosia sp. XJ19-1]|uniref:Anti-sigma factor n=1 Tax=Devosia ureilytica TaxID=2952754 RepID=A0A9Q4AQS6_9HYPH|nr:anti-sigma factor [Devosia ureilytica]MCP8884549.1 anti-sigma factor [Devosia ureilytica]MCP8888179.1 anti-sigma factor [Devosia ureilytica]
MSEDQDRKGDGGRSALVAEYVLGLLSPADHARVERQIEADPALQAERDFWSARFAALDSEFAEVPTPAHTLEQIEGRLFGVAKRPGFWDSLALWRGITAGALAVAVAAIGFNLMRPGPDVTSLTTQLVAALEAEGSDVRFLALYDGTGAVRLTALSGDVASDRDLELWAIQGGQDPISMGVIPVNQRSVVELSEQVRAGWGEGSVLAITLEPKGGAPEGKATGPVVALGEVHQI